MTVAHCWPHCGPLPRDEGPALYVSARDPRKKVMRKKVIRGPGQVIDQDRP